VSKVTFNTMRYTISGYYPPHLIEIYGSKDGSSYSLIDKIEQMDIAEEQGRNKLLVEFGFDSVEIRNLRVVCKTFGSIPEGHHRAGESASMKIDEIVVE